MEEKFVPFNNNHGNVDGEIAYLRDTFLNSEMEYLKHLLSSESIRKNMEELLNYNNPELLYKKAIERIEKIENGEVDEKHLPIIEGEITLLLASIQDKALINELILINDENDEKSMSR